MANKMPCPVLIWRQAPLQSRHIHTIEPKKAVLWSASVQKPRCRAERMCRPRDTARCGRHAARLAAERRQVSLAALRQRYISPRDESMPPNVRPADCGCAQLSPGLARQLRCKASRRPQ
jgi:hypothetical protein